MPVDQETIINKLCDLSMDLDKNRRNLHSLHSPNSPVGTLGYCSSSNAVKQIRLILNMISDEVSEIECILEKSETPEELKRKAYSGLSVVSRETKCPKCACDKISIALKEQSHRGNYFSSDITMRQLYEKYSYYLMERKCTECQYVWYEKPLDEELIKETVSETNELRVGDPVKVINPKYFIHNVRTEEHACVALTFDENTKFVVDGIPGDGTVNLRTSAGTFSVKIKVHNKNDIQKVSYA